MLEPLGQSQVLRYMEKLKEHVLYTLISYEKPHLWKDRKSVNAIREYVEQIGVQWYPLRYHQRPTIPSTLWDLLQGFWRGLWLIRKHRVQIIHARSYVMGTLALWLSSVTGIPWVFDIRGFWVDERVDVGPLSRETWLYRGLKHLERVLFRHAHGIVTLTQKSLDLLHSFPWYPRGKPEQVIPTCVDLSHFQFQPSHKTKNTFVLGYVGTTGGWYLFEPVLRFVKFLYEVLPNMTFWIITRDNPVPLWEFIHQRGIPESIVQIEARPFEKIPEAMQKFNASVFFLKPTFSKQASSPTRFAELMASGVPVVTNTGYGDLENLISRYRVGVLVSDFSDTSLQNAVRELLNLLQDPELPRRCRLLAEELFSAESGARRYLALYQEILKQGFGKRG